MMRRWFWLPLALLLVACDSTRPLIVQGDKAPDFTLLRLDGAPVQLSALRGRVVAVRFWADWCPFCGKEMEAIEPIYRRRRQEGLRVLAINVAQDRETAARFVRKHGVSYDVLLDSEAEVARAYGVIALPVTYFVDAEGVVCGKILGESDATTFESQVERCLSGGTSDGGG